MSFDIYDTNDYLDDVAAIDTAFHAGLDADVSAFAQWLRDAGSTSLHAIGAGGSLAIAQFATSMHERVTRRVSRASTPLDYFERVSGVDGVGLVISASGRHRDIRTTAGMMAAADDADRWAIFFGTENSAAEAILAGSPARSFTASVLPENYGWLSVGALVGQAVVVARAYAEAFPELGAVSSRLADYLPDDAPDPLAAVRALAERGGAALARPHLSLLHGNDGLPMMLDVESKFAESGLGPFTPSEYRNFAHGRYQMLLPDPQLHGILAVASTDETRLAETVLEVLPEEIPGMLLTLRGETVIDRGLSAIIAAVVVVGALGVARGIRPGWGSRNTFGDVIYEMPLEDVLPQRSA